MNESTIFAAALEKVSDAERADFLNEACAGDEKLRRRVEALLKAHAAPDSILDAAKHGPATTDIQPITETTGTRIGPYRLMEQIGEGGFGVVFVAEQQEPVRRKVALKLIKPGMDSNQVIARFEAERQALAMMDHPNIARVLDAGATETGRPYFVMELVRGIPITEYCDKNQLNPSERMEIFVTVCHAIQHAHQKGIIHRDIKPSNVLVTSHDGKPVAKVIDFGVAKAIHQQLTERTIYTQFAQMIGTPLYMSPEQAEMSGLDIDTRSDIYSLGVLLYELFTGSTPLEKSRLVSAAFDEVRRLIREDEPLRPSQRLSTSATLSSLAASRKTEPSRLSHQMKRELDWIVMKALEKDRTRRYETAGAFAADIGRYLRDEQVEACPPSITYQLRKFIRRNRFVFVSGSLVASALLMGVIFSSWFALHAREQRNIAQMERLAAEQERDRAEKSQQAAMEQSQLAEAERQNAEAARASEKSQRSAAEQERDKATALSEELAREKTELSRQKEEQRRMLYISDMNLVQSAWEADNIDRVQELLNAHRPQPGQVDLRGFEWHYWNRQCHQELQVVKLPESISVSAVFSADGMRLAAVTGVDAYGAAKIKVWDTNTGDEVVALPLPRNQTSSDVLMHFHPNGNQLAVSLLKGSNSIDLQMWDIATGTSLRSIRTQPETDAAQESLAGATVLWISDDSRRLATVVALNDGEIPWQRVMKFWDTETGAELAAIPLGRQRLSGVTISPDGSRIAFASPTAAAEGLASGSTIRILNVESPETAVMIPLTWDALLRFSPDGTRLFVSGSDSAGEEASGAVYDAVTGQKRLVLPEIGIWRWAAISPDGEWLAVTSWSHPGKVMLYSTSRPQEPIEFKGFAIPLGFSQDSRRLFTATYNGSIKTWQIAAAAESEPSTSFSSLQLVNMLSSASSDGTKIATTLSPHASPVTVSALPPEASRNVVTLRDETGKLLYQTAELDGRIHWIRFSPDGRRLAACALVTNAEAETAAQFCVWDTASGAQQLRMRLPAIQDSYAAPVRLNVPGAAFSPDGNLFAIMTSLGLRNARTSRIKVWEIDAQRDAFECEAVNHPVAEIMFSPDGRRIMGGSNNGPDLGPTVWDATSGRLLWDHQIAVSMPGFSTGSTQVFGYRYGSQEIKLWDAASGRELVSIRGPDYSSWSKNSSKIVLSPDGQLLVPIGYGSVGSADASSTAVRVWNVAQPEREIFLLKGHNQRVRAVTFSPDNRRIVTSAGRNRDNGEVKLWDADTGLELLTLRGGARNIAFNASGTVLIGELGSSLIGGIHVERWDASPLPPQVEAEQIVGALTTVRGQDALPLISEILARIEADQTLPDDTRTRAVTLVKGLPREKELNDAALAIAALPGQPTEKYERALHYLEEVSVADPDNRHAWTTRGLALYRLGLATEALAALARSEDLHANQKLSRPAEDLTIRAMVQHRAGQHDEARTTLEQVRTSASRNETTWQKLLAEAETLLEIPNASDEPEKWIGHHIMPRRAATVKHEDGSVVHPNLPYTIDRVEGDRLWFGKNSIARSEIVQLEDADSYYTHDLQAGQDTVGGYQRRGDAWRVLGKFDQAIEDFSAAIQLSPSNSYLYQQRGEVWQHCKYELDKALADFDAGLQISPNSTSLHIARGRVLLDQGKYDEALKSFDDAIGVLPTLGLAFVWRGRVWSAKGDRDKMMQDFEQGVLLSPEDADVWTLRAWHMATSPKLEHRDGHRAVSDATKACKLTDWKNSNCLENLAAAYAETDDFAQAIKWQEKAVNLTPPGKRAEFEVRLKLYCEGQKFRHDRPRSNPAAEAPINANTSQDDE